MLERRRIHRDLEVLQSNLEKLLHDSKDVAVDEIAETASGLAGKSTEQLRQLAKQAEETFGKLRDQIRETSDKVEATIEDHPYAAMGAALGVGILLGKLVNLGKRRAA